MFTTTRATRQGNRGLQGKRVASSQPIPKPFLTGDQTHNESRPKRVRRLEDARIGNTNASGLTIMGANEIEETRATDPDGADPPMSGQSMLEPEFPVRYSGKGILTFESPIKIKSIRGPLYIEGPLIVNGQDVSLPPPEVLGLLLDPTDLKIRDRLLLTGEKAFSLTPVGGTAPFVYTLQNESPAGVFQTIPGVNELQIASSIDTFLPTIQYSFQIKVDDSQGKTFTTAVQVIDMVALYDFTLDSENVLTGSTAGTVVGNLAPLGGEGTITFTIVPGSDVDDKFEIVGTELRLKATVDSTVKGQHELEIQASGVLYGNEKIRPFTIVVSGSVNALELNGTTEKLRSGAGYPSPPVAKLTGLTEFSCSFWMQVPTIMTTPGYMVSAGKAVATHFFWAGIRVASVDDRFAIRTMDTAGNQIQGNWNLTGAQRVNTGTLDWHFVTFTAQLNQNPLLYTNGALCPVLTYSPVETQVTAFQETRDFQIGGVNDTGNLYDGRIDNVVIWDGILTLADHQELYDSGNGQLSKENPAQLTSGVTPLSWYRLEGLVGGEAVDEIAPPLNLQTVAVTGSNFGPI